MFELSNGYKAIYPCISEKPHNISLEEFNEYFLCFFDEIREILLRSFLISFTHFTNELSYVDAKDKKKKQRRNMFYPFEYIDMEQLKPFSEARYSEWRNTRGLFKFTE